MRHRASSPPPHRDWEFIYGKAPACVCVKVLRSGHCLNQQSAYYNQYTLLRDTEPRNTRVVTHSKSE